MLEPKTFIFIGLPGSGKGTQVKELQEYIKGEDPEREQFALSTGVKFRDFIKGDSYTQKLSKEVYETGALQPEFLAVWLWAQLFIDNIKGGEHMFIDGFPRILSEAKAFDSAIKFYKRECPYVLFLDVSKDVTKDRLRKRLTEEGRTDDLETAVEERLKWYDECVLPVIDFFRGNDTYDFHTINGDQTVEEVHSDILKVIN